MKQSHSKASNLATNRSLYLATYLFLTLFIGAKHTNKGLYFMQNILSRTLKDKLGTHSKKKGNQTISHLNIYICNKKKLSFYNYPYLGSKAIALGCSIAPAINVVLKVPSSFATSIWSKLLSIQYMFPAIQSTVRPSGVARPCCTTTSMALTP